MAEGHGGKEVSVICLLLHSVCGRELIQVTLQEGVSKGQKDKACQHPEVKITQCGWQ